MDDAELKRRKIELLDRWKLKKEVNKLLKNKGFTANCYRASNILTGVEPSKKDWTIVTLDAVIGNADQHLGVTIIIFIPKDIYYDDKFTWIDSWIPGRLRTDDRILLRALRVVFNVVKDINTAAAAGRLSTSKPITIKATVDGDGKAAIDYNNYWSIITDKLQ